ncbi:MAG: hydroxyethylthiazole kinase [Clostridia bacterium]|nr:hydroxyethylthiazole kinase [Clostridia bacterium]
MFNRIIVRNRARHPLIHCIDNHVTSNDCANLLLGCGASPIMAEAPEEVSEITSGCDGLVLNLGTPSTGKIEAMCLAGQRAGQLGHPIVFDPVGVGASSFRRAAARRILDTVPVTVIRGNAGELEVLYTDRPVPGGVDAPEHEAEGIIHMARRVAQQRKAVVVVSGAEDIVTDGTTLYLVRNGTPMMRLVTGTGCMLSALTGAYLAACPESPLIAALAAVCAHGICGQWAARRLSPTEGNASFRTYLLDALSVLTDETLEKEALYEKIY